MPTLTQEQWDSYKSQFPKDKKLQAITLDELLKNTLGGKVNYAKPPMAKEGGVQLRTQALISECQLAIGYVIFDAICLALGAVGLRATLKRTTAEAVAGAAKSVFKQIKEIVKGIGKETSKTDLGWAVFKILKTIWSGGCLGAVVSAFWNSLTLSYKLLYGATAFGTIVAFLATDGVAFVAEVVIVLATFGFLVVDAVNATNVCGLKR